jgi:hypothetical protein
MVHALRNPGQNGDSGESMVSWRCRDYRVRTQSWQRIQKKISTVFGAKVSQLGSFSGGGEFGARMAL